MSHKHAPIIAGELDLAERSVNAALALFDDGATIPFIARYRKERTGGLDEVALQEIRERRHALAELDARKEAVLASLDEQAVADEELRGRIAEARTRAEVEDLYLPYRPKRRTRAQVARERGLGRPANDIISRRFVSAEEIAAAAASFVDPTRGLPDTAAVLSGARDIVAEGISESADVRAGMRELFRRHAVLSCKSARGSKASPEVTAKFRDYFEWSEPAATAPSHRVLAVMRGCREGVLSCHLLPDEERALGRLRALVLGRRRNGDRRVALPASAAKSACDREIALAAEDSYRRLLAPQLETELRGEVLARAESEAVSVFARNLRELLMAPPLGEKVVLALDPGFRTGCKLVVLSPQGELLHFETIYPLEPISKTREAADRILTLVESHKVEAIAVGNGTGGREATDFCRGLSYDRRIIVSMVDESGASVYSASKAGREEFPDQDVTVRGAVSIGRRLQDPLAELVKVEPKSLGVGQYQHDVNQKLLAGALADVVVSCVNAVGVDVNSASSALLRYVSGISESLARRIVEHRREHGRFEQRPELMEVSGFGPKSFEQSAGFLRIRDGTNPLDAGGVHPERYSVVRRMARDLGVDLRELVGNPDLVRRIVPAEYVDDDVGLPTVKDILSELAKPGRDPRTEFVEFRFAEGVESMEDLSVGMRLPGIVTNVTAFGAFVDVGVHNDGLVHISKMARRFVRDPHEVVKVHQQVMVTVVSLDQERRRIGLSLTEGEEE